MVSRVGLGQGRAVRDVVLVKVLLDLDAVEGGPGGLHIDAAALQVVNVTGTKLEGHNPAVCNAAVQGFRGDGLRYIGTFRPLVDHDEAAGEDCIGIRSQAGLFRTHVEAGSHVVEVC